jgi:hypothetical protein
MRGFIIKGHCLLKVDPNNRHLAKCSCGASERLLAMATRAGRTAARRNWHDQHKSYVYDRQLSLRQRLTGEDDHDPPTPLGTYESWGKE